MMQPESVVRLSTRLGCQSRGELWFKSSRAGYHSREYHLPAFTTSLYPIAHQQPYSVPVSHHREVIP